VRTLDGSFWGIFLSVAIVGIITWLAVFEHNYDPRIYSYSDDVTILQVGERAGFQPSERAIQHLVAEWREGT